ncbi:MAG: zinc ribbon domain-containing protein [Burkholderiales bacterium]|nr:zinc ribbon domain-containing protein [Burkholderiales bacterium]
MLPFGKYRRDEGRSMRCEGGAALTTRPITVWEAAVIPLTCPQCKLPSAAEARFCSGCGAALQRQECPSCNAVNDGAARHCHACGVQVRSQAGETPTTAVVQAAEAAEAAATQQAAQAMLAAVAVELAPGTGAASPVEETTAVEEARPVEPSQSGAALQPVETVASVASAESAEEGHVELAAAAAPEPPRSAAMPLQQLADRGALRSVPTMARAIAPPDADTPSIETITLTTLPSSLPATLPVALSVSRPTAMAVGPPDTAAGSFPGSVWQESVQPADPPRANWIGPFFVGLGTVSVVTLAITALMIWPHQAPPVPKRQDTPVLAGTGKVTPGPAADAAADAAAEAAARLLGATTQPAARAPDGRAADPLVPSAQTARPPARAAAPPRAAVRLAAQAPEATATVGPTVAPPPAAEAPRPRPVRPSPPQPSLPRECTAAMDALGLCAPGSKPSGS